MRLHVLLLVLASGCRSVDVTPASLAAADVPAEESAALMATWEEGLDLANEFLVSDFRLTLPTGRYELAHEDGMRFATEHGTWPVEVRSTTWGDICVRIGFIAQERTRGFIVGKRDPDRDPVADNSLFRDSGGNPASAAYVASLVLHETTHSVYRHGTIGFGKSVLYYLETIFLFRYETHSGERRANATTHEFQLWTWWRQADESARDAGYAYFQSHLAESDGKKCTHGPFPPPPDPPEL